MTHWMHDHINEQDIVNYSQRQQRFRNKLWRDYNRRMRWLAFKRWLWGSLVPVAILIALLWGLVELVARAL